MVWQVYDGCKTSVGDFIRDSVDSERDIERLRKLESGLSGKY